MIEVNLIPDVKQELLKAQKARRLVITISIIVGLGMLGVVAFLSAYTFLGQNIYMGTLDSSIKDKTDKLKKVEDLSKVLTIQNQLTKISDMHSNKNINSRIFNLLTVINPPAPNTVQYTSITYYTVDEKREIRIEGQTSGFPALETFRKTIENSAVKWITEEGELEVPLASSISLPETSYGIDTSGNTVLRFSITFNYAKEFLLPSSTNATVQITGSGDILNVTDSYQGIPESLFVNRAVDAN